MGERTTGGLNTGEALKLLGARLMTAADVDTCIEGLTLYTELSQLIRLCIDGMFDPKDAPAGADRSGLPCRDTAPTSRRSRAKLKRLSKAVRKVFLSVVRGLRRGPLSGIRSDMTVPMASREQNLHTAAMQAYQRAGDGKPEPGAALALGKLALHLLEGLADLAECCFRDADAGIGDRQRRRRLSTWRARTSIWPPSLVNFTRVGEKVEQDLLQRTAVGQQC